jgi:hypothetical protein
VGRCASTIRQEAASREASGKLDGVLDRELGPLGKASFVLHGRMRLPQSNLGPVVTRPVGDPHTRSQRTAHAFGRTEEQGSDSGLLGGSRDGGQRLQRPGRIRPAQRRKEIERLP